MKKYTALILAAVISITMLSGCSILRAFVSAGKELENASQSTVSPSETAKPKANDKAIDEEDWDGEEESKIETADNKKLPEFSDDIYLGIEYGVDIEYDEIAAMASEVRIYEGGVVKVFMEDELLGECTIPLEKMKIIKEAADRDILYDIDPGESDDVMDGAEETFFFYGKNNEIIAEKRAYVPKNEYYQNAFRAVCENMNDEWVSSIIDAEKEILRERKNLQREVERIILQYPGKGYYISDKAAAEVPQNSIHHTLKQLSVEKNDIIDSDLWLYENGLEECRVNTTAGYYIESDMYYFHRDGEEPYYPTKLEIYDKDMNYLTKLDIEEFVNPNDKMDSFWNEAIYWAYPSQDGKVIYISIGHCTYSSQAPETAFVIAVDMETYEVLWKSDNLVANACNFAVLDDDIVCGYGFTDEPDYIYILDRHTGVLRETYKVLSGPDFIYNKDGRLLVRTYDRNYEFEIN